MKRVVLLSASPRKNGNSDILCHQFIKGAEDAGHDCELITPIFTFFEDLSRSLYFLC